jgi:hypothetical protein
VIYGDVSVEDSAPAPNGAGSGIDVVQVEIDDYLRRLKELNSLPPTEVFQTLSAISARLAEIRNRLIRIESRRTTALRTREIDPLIDEVDRQFKFHSRIASVRQMEWDATTGGGQL